MRRRGCTAPSRTRTERPRSSRPARSSRPSSPSRCEWTVTASHLRPSLACGSLRAALRAACGATLVALCTSGLGGCATERALVPGDSGLEPLVDEPARPPDEMERSTRSLAAAVLLGDGARAAEVREQIDALDRERIAFGAPPSGLAPYAADAENATISDPRAFRAAQRALLERDDLPPALERRVENEVKDDPLSLADERLGDARSSRIARTVNAFTRAIGTSFANPVLLAYRVSMAALGFGLSERQQDPLTPPERQALGHWKSYVERYPDSPESEALLAEIEEVQRRWLETQRRRQLRLARQALELGHPALAASYADRALDYSPENPEATRLRDEAQKRLALEQENLRRSLEAQPLAKLGNERALAVALLAPGGDVAGRATRLAETAGDGPLADEAAFAEALAAFDSGRERATWKQLEALAGESPTRSNMARHAAAWLDSPEENPYRAFRRANRQITAKQWRVLALGALADGAPNQDLSRPLEWLAAIPTVPGVIFGLPARLIRFPFDTPDRRVPAVLARRYLERFPHGEEAAGQRDWLLHYEEGRGNRVAALRIAESAPAPDLAQLNKLREEAAKQALETARKERRIEVRLPLLLEVATQFPGTQGALEAGEAVREEMEHVSEQRIRVSKGYLLENPSVVGRDGLALRPELLDGELENGELHPDGLTLIGADQIELAFVAPSGRTSDEPTRRRESIGKERLARFVAQLEQSSEQIARTDRDARFEPDARRDQYFERARLGVGGEIDPRATARSSYEYIGLRERYGVVRGRESILPAEIVLQGSFTDFGLGAFPRLRLPEPTPDQILYR